MSRRKMVVRVGVILLTVLTAGLAVACCLWPGSVFEPFVLRTKFYLNSTRVEEGMTLEQVEALLGPGREVGPHEVPLTVVEVPPPGVKYEPPGPNVTAYRYPTKTVPAVEGDRIFRWDEFPDRPGTSSYLLVGFRNGKVSGKFYWSYSL